jgi:hypothetical protein
MDSKQLEIKNLIVNNLSLTVQQLNQLPDQTITQVKIQLPSGFLYSNKKKYIKFNGCAFELLTNGILQTTSNISIHSNIANTTNTIGTCDQTSYNFYKPNPNQCTCENCKSEANCDHCSCYKCRDCNKCWSFTSHTGCNVDREAIKVDQRCNDYVGMVNNYLSPKTYCIDSTNINHLEIYFLNSLGERVCIFDKSGINVTQALFKIDLEMILEY